MKTQRKINDMEITTKLRVLNSCELVQGLIEKRGAKLKKKKKEKALFERFDYFLSLI